MSLHILNKVKRLKAVRDRHRKYNAEFANRYNPYNVPEDFKEFARLCRIRSGAEYLPFELFDYQEEIGKLYDICKGIAAFKTRQLGFSEVITCKMLHRSLINPAYLGVTFSLGQQESSKLSDRVGMMPSQIPTFSWSTDSKTARKSQLGGELLFRPSTENASRSLASVHDLFFDEAGFPPKISQMYGASTPAQSMVPNAKRILATTIPVEGRSCWFYTSFWDSSQLGFDLDEELARVREGRGRQDKGFSYWIDADGWAHILLHWHSHPIYCQIPNYLQKVKREEKITDEQLGREYNLEFPQLGGSLFNQECIENYGTSHWAPPIPGHHYIIGVDPNFGGSDPFVAEVWDITTMPYQLVAQYREGNRSTSYSRQKVVELIDQYDPILTAVESNSGGVTTAENLITDRPNARIELTKTSHASKRVNTDRIALALEQGEVTYPADWHGKSEMRKFSAQLREGIGETDDCIMAWAAAWAWLETALSSKPKKRASIPVAAKLNTINSLNRHTATPIRITKR